MRGVLALLQPWDPVAGARVDVRVGAARNTRTLHADGQSWQSAINRMPRLSQELVDDDITGQLMVGRGDMTVSGSRLRGVANLARLEWSGAKIQIWSGDGGSVADLRLEFQGQILGGVMNRDDGTIPLTFEVDRKLIDVPMLNLEYGGGGGADGEPEVRGQLKPAAFGRPVGVPVFFFDQTLWIGQVDAYGNCLGIDVLFENGASFGPKHANYATYAELKAAVVPEGSWATCVAEGMIRLGAPPRGVITTDPVCGADRAGSMGMRWLTKHANVPADRIDAASFDSLTASIDTLVGRAVPVNYWAQSQKNVLDRLQRLAASCNAMLLLRLDGKIAVTRVPSNAAAVLEVNRQSSTRRVLGWRSLNSVDPWWRLKMSAASTYRLHDENEINFENDLVDLGDYDATEEYRLGNIVRQPKDGRRYLYINAAPSTGNAPPNVTYWSVYEDAPDATVIRYPDGKLLSDLQPQETGANKTESRTAAAILGQGKLATKHTIDYRTDIAGDKPDINATTGSLLNINASFTDFPAGATVTKPGFGPLTWISTGNVGGAGGTTAGPVTGVAAARRGGKAWRLEGTNWWYSNQKIPCAPGDTIYGTIGWMNVAAATAAGNQELFLRLLFYNSANANLGAGPLVRAVGEVGVYNVRTASAKAPAGSAYCTVELLYNWTGPADSTGGTFDIDFIDISAQAPGATSSDLATLAVNKAMESPNGDLSERSATGRPAGWHHSYYDSEPNGPWKYPYIEGFESVIELPGYTGIATGAFAVEDQNEYEIVLRVRSMHATNRARFFGYISQTNRQLETGKKFIICIDAWVENGAEAGYQADSTTVKNKAGEFQWVPETTEVNGVWVDVVFPYKPTAGTKWGSLQLVNWEGSFGISPVQIDRAFVRSKSTYGADINANVTDGANGGAPVPRTDLKTSIGTAAAIAGQGGLATLHHVGFGNTGYIREGQGGDVIATIENFKTPIGTAAAIAGQGTGATASTLSGLNPSEGDKLKGIEAGATRADNLVQNADLSDGTNGWANISNLVREAGVAADPVTGAPGDPVPYLWHNPNASTVNGRAQVPYGPVPPTSKLFCSFWNKAAAANQQTQVLSSCYDAAGAFVGNGVFDYFAPDTAWRLAKGVISLPPSTAFIYTDWTIPGGVRAGNLRLAAAELNATLGADIDVNVYDRGDGGKLLTRAELRTILGIASGFTGQGGLATLNEADWNTRVGNRPIALTDIDTATGRLRATRMQYGDAIPVEDLKPLEVGANKTETRTAAAIASQGSLATREYVYFDSGYIREADLGVNATLPNFKTSSGTAAGIASQGALATLNDADWNTRVGNRPLALTDLDATSGRLRASRMQYGNAIPVEDLMPGELGANKTETRTAAGIAGQGSLATKNRTRLGDPALHGEGAIYNEDLGVFLTNANTITAHGTAAAIVSQGALATLNEADWGTRVGNRPIALTDIDGATGRLRATRMQYGDAIPVEDLKPGELGSNKTETRTAAAISGQGPLATRSTADWQSHVSGTGKPADNASADIILEGSAFTIQANKAVKISGGSWEVATAKQPMIGVAVAQWRWTALGVNVDLQAGLSRSRGNPSQTWHISDWAIAVHTFQDTYEIIGNDAFHNSTGTFKSTSHLMTVTYDGVSYRAYADTTLLGTVTAPNPNETLYFKLRVGPGGYGAQDVTVGAHTDISRSRRFDPATGRGNDPTLLYTSGVVGAKGTNDVVLSAGTDGVVSVPQHERRFPGATAQHVRTYGAGSVATGQASDTRVFIFTEDPDLNGGTVSYFSTTNSDDIAALTKRVYVGTVIIPASGTSTSDPGTGGGGGGDILP